MRKILLASIAAILFASTSSMAHDSTGCGLGSMAWRGQKGTLQQILAVTTNGFFGTQTFGISSGTSGCDPNGTITGGTQKMFSLFLEDNLEQYAFDASRGSGETITTIAGILNVSEELVAKISKENFDKLFPNADVDSLHVASTFISLLPVA